MTRHVPDESLPDLAEGAGSGVDRAHAAACASCAARVDEARAALALARRANVPEPSPHYWEVLRRNVGRRISEQRQRGPRWSWLAPVAAAAAATVAVVALTAGRTHPPARTPEPTLAAWSALPAAEDDASLDVLEGLAVADAGVGDLDEGRGVGAFLADLTDEDNQALADSLRRARLGGES
jgi:hypothetical protein